MKLAVRKSTELLLASPNSFCGMCTAIIKLIIFISLLLSAVSYMYLIYTRTSFVGQLSKKLCCAQPVHCSNEIFCQKQVVKLINNRY